MSRDAANPYGDTKTGTMTLGTVAERPGGLTAISIMAILLGSLGLFSALLQVASLAGGRRMQRAYLGASPLGAPAEMRQVQEDFNASVGAVVDRYFAVNTTLAIVHFAVAGALILGGVRTFRLRGRRILLAACLGAGLFEIARTVPYILIQIEMLPLVEAYMPRMMESTAPPGQPGAEAGAQIGAVLGRLVTIGGIVFFLGWCLVKLIFYSTVARYLSKAPIRRLFATQPASLA